MNNTIGKELIKTNKQINKMIKEDNKEQTSFEEDIKSKTDEAYMQVWESLISSYRSDAQIENIHEQYTIFIDKIGLEGLYMLYKTNQLTANYKALYELLEYMDYNKKQNNDKITVININNEEIHVILENYFMKQLQKDGFITLNSEIFSIDTSILEKYMNHYVSNQKPNAFQRILNKAKKRK